MLPGLSLVALVVELSLQLKLPGSFVEFHAPLDLGQLIRSSTFSLAIGELLTTGLYSGSSTRSCCFTGASYERFPAVALPLGVAFRKLPPDAIAQKKSVSDGRQLAGACLTAHVHCEQLASVIAGTRVFLESLQI
jgi:hypothetical protein